MEIRYEVRYDGDREAHRTLRDIDEARFLASMFNAVQNEIDYYVVKVTRERV